MTLGTQIQMIFIPVWARLLVAVLVLGSLLVSVYLFWSALTGGERPDWMAAGAQLLGVVFPVAILGIVLGGGSFGDASILKRTEGVLRRTLPYHLQFIPDEPQSFVDFRKARRSPLTDPARLAQVAVHHSKGRCHADYRLEVPMGEARLRLMLRVELNVRRVNVNILFRKDRLAAMVEPGETLFETLDRIFPHSVQAEAGPQPVIFALPEQRGAISYRMNATLLPREVDGVAYVALVASANVASDLVWNPSEKVYFAQDLTFMLKAFLQENPAVFAGGAAA